MPKARVTESGLYIELDGPNVSPASIDALKALSLAQAYFYLITREAIHEKENLQLCGLEVLDKCAAIVTYPNIVEVAESAVRLADQHISGGLSIPPGLERSVQQVRVALRQLPSEYTTRVKVGRVLEELLVAEAIPRFAPSITNLRVLVVRVGGKEPKVRFASPSENKEFSVGIGIDMARELGSTLYREVEIRVRLVRDFEGTIDSERSEILGYRLLDDEDARRTWRAWFHDNAGAWDHVDDVEVELGRG